MVGAIILRFLSPEQPITILHWKENDGSFPNITLCSNRIFDMAKVQGLLFTNETTYICLHANYEKHLEVQGQLKDLLK